jgi:hypothetical protein
MMAADSYMRCKSPKRTALPSYACKRREVDAASDEHRHNVERDALGDELTYLLSARIHPVPHVLALDAYGRRAGHEEEVYRLTAARSPGAYVIRRMDLGVCRRVVVVLQIGETAEKVSARERAESPVRRDLQGLPDPVVQVA